MTTKPIILLVDDLDFFLEMEKDYLSKTQADIRIAKNGKIAIETARRVLPDLIYMDVQMPVMDGMEACRKIKQDPLLRNIPIVMVFTETGGVTRESVMLCGCDDALIKPVDRKLFLEVGRKFLYHVERRDKRVSCRTTVEFRINGLDRQGLSHDLSKNGVYVECREALKQGDHVYLSFLLPTISSHKIQARGRIAWVNQGFPRTNNSLPQGFGIEFQNLDSICRRMVEEYVKKATN
ncbi:MAG: response regulator [Desulfuromonadales bacterium]|nr:response regulator [Desulfuromonadales bacterium]